MTRRRLGGWLLVAALIMGTGVLALRPVEDAAPDRLPPAPPASAARPGVAAVARDAGRLLDGGPKAYRARVRALRGVPVVVNQWASWCGPCRYEFPFFRRLAHRYRGRVAFLGVNAQDVRDDAREFLREFPTPFPHFYDPDATIAREFNGGRAWPTTAFYTANGGLARTHVGSYSTESKLNADIRKWALGD